MRTMICTVVLAALATTGALAQDGGKSTARTYVKVVVNGKVVEERGDPSLMRMLEGIRRDPASARASSSSSSSHSRRVVVRNGKTIVDEETRDGRVVRGKPGARAPMPRGEDLLKRMRGGLRSLPDLERELRRLEARTSAGRRAARGGKTARSTPRAPKEARIRGGRGADTRTRSGSRPLRRVR